MNILLLNHYAGSPSMGMEFRPYYLAKEWKAMGHNVRIVAANYSHLRKQQPENVGLQQVDGMDYYVVATNRYRGNGVQRVCSMASYIAKVALQYKKICRDFVPDIVIASSTYPLDNYVAQKIARHYGAQHVYEIHDLWPLSPMELGGYSPQHPFIKVMQAAEDYAYRHADVVVSMLPKAIDHAKTRGLHEEKFFYVPNGVVLDEWDYPQQLSADCQQFVSDIKARYDMVVGYLGGHALSNCLMPFIEAAQRLQGRKIAFLLVGNGVEKAHLQQRVSDEKLDHVFFLPPIAKPQVPTMLDLMDVLYIGWTKNPLYRFGISPNKIYDYQMAGKPIVHAVEAANDPVQEAGCGISVPPEDADRIAQAILQLADMSVAERNALGERGKAYVLKNHTYALLAKKFLSACKA